MKKLILLVFLVTITKSSFSQTFTLDPGNVDTVFAPYDELTIFDIYPVNITNEKILFHWTKIAVNVPVGWDYSLCDYGNCYTGIPNGGTMDSVDVGGMGLLGLNISPYSIAGQGIVKIYVYDANFPNDGDTVTWVVNSSALGVEENFASLVSIYPNPATDFIMVNQESFNFNEFTIYSIEGKLLVSGTLNLGSRIELNLIPNGTFLLQLNGKNGSFISKFTK